MKRLINIATLCIACPARADSPLQKEYETTKGQRDKAIAAAVDPINKRYQASLEILMKKATVAGDLELALKFKNEMEALSKTTALGEPTLEALAAFVPGEWFIGEANDWMVIRPDKTVFYKHKDLNWKIEKDGSVSITDNKTRKKASFRFDPKTNTYSGTEWEGKPLAGKRKK
jgi:hypothetical protein